MGKGKYTYVWVSLIILIFGIIFIPRIIDRVRTGTVVQRDELDVKGPNDALSYLFIDGKKRKVPSFALVDQDSLLITDKDYLGKVYVVDFFFTTCPSICPLLTQNLVDIQKEFKDVPNVGMASFSINPRYDTPMVLKEYAEKYGITDLDWHLLTGDHDQIYDIANKGFNIFAEANKEAPGGFEHSGMFALVDKKGYLRCRTDAYGNPIIYYRGTIGEDEKTDEVGETEQISILKEDIKKLLKE